MLPMFKTAISSMFKKRATVLYPVEIKSDAEIARGQVDILLDKCIFCGLCQKKCLTDAIKVVRAESLWSINKFDCIQCGNCIESCPKKCLVMNTSRPNPAYKIDVVTMQVKKEEEAYKGELPANDNTTNPQDA